MQNFVDATVMECASSSPTLLTLEAHGFAAVEALGCVYALFGLALVVDAHLVLLMRLLMLRLSLPEDVAGAGFLAIVNAAPELIVSCEPAAFTAPIPAAGGEVIVCSDGVWDSVPDGLIGLIVSEGRKRTAAKICQRILVEHRPFTSIARRNTFLCGSRSRSRGRRWGC